MSRPLLIPFSTAIWSTTHSSDEVAYATLWAGPASQVVKFRMDLQLELEAIGALSVTPHAQVSNDGKTWSDVTWVGTAPIAVTGNSVQQLGPFEIDQFHGKQMVRLVLKVEDDPGSGLVAGQVRGQLALFSASKAELDVTGTYVAGDGLNLTGTTFSVASDVVRSDGSTMFLDVDSGNDFVVREGGSEVGRYDGSNGSWQFSHAGDFGVEAGSGYNVHVNADGGTDHIAFYTDPSPVVAFSYDRSWGNYGQWYMSRRLALDTGGHTHISSPSAKVGSLYVRNNYGGSTNNAYTARFINTTGLAVRCVSLGFPYATDSTSRRYIEFEYATEATRGWIYSTGSQMAFGWSSDARMKKGVERAATAGRGREIVEAASPVDYLFLDDDDGRKAKRRGWIAQELMEVYPEAVIEPDPESWQIRMGEDGAEEVDSGPIPEEAYLYGVGEQALFIPLWECAQETSLALRGLEVENGELRRRLSALEERIAALEARLP